MFNNNTSVSFSEENTILSVKRLVQHYESMRRQRIIPVKANEVTNIATSEKKCTQIVLYNNKVDNKDLNIKPNLHRVMIEKFPIQALKIDLNNLCVIEEPISDNFNVVIEEMKVEPISEDLNIVSEECSIDTPSSICNRNVIIVQNENVLANYCRFKLQNDFLKTKFEKIMSKTKNFFAKKKLKSDANVIPPFLIDNILEMKSNYESIVLDLFDPRKDDIDLLLEKIEQNENLNKCDIFSENQKIYEISKQFLNKRGGFFDENLGKILIDFSKKKKLGKFIEIFYLSLSPEEKYLFKEVSELMKKLIKNRLCSGEVGNHVSQFFINTNTEDKLENFNAHFKHFLYILEDVNFDNIVSSEILAKAKKFEKKVIRGENNVFYKRRIFGFHSCGL